MIFETPCDKEVSYPRFQKETLELIGALRERTPEQIQELMSLSENLAELNVSRYQKFSRSKNTKRAKQAVYAFKGDVYLGLEAEELSNGDIHYAQDHFEDTLWSLWVVEAFGFDSTLSIRNGYAFGL